MKTSPNVKRIRPWQLALTAVVMGLPFVAPALDTGDAGFIRQAFAAETGTTDTSRLVSIGGAVTEIIYELGEQGRLIARDSTSQYPEAATRLPDVGYMRALSPEGVLGVNPSAIIAVEGSGPPEALNVLHQASIPFETVPEKYDRDGILAKIDTIGTFLGVEDKAKVLHDKVAADLDAAITDAEKRPESERKRVLFILSMQGGKIMASGTGTAADGILKLSGATNAVGSFQGYKPLTDEAIIEAKPDVILMMDRGGNHGASSDELFSNAALSLTPAAASKALIRMDGLHLLGFGPRTASAVRQLNAAIYGNGHVSE